MLPASAIPVIIGVLSLAVEEVAIDDGGFGTVVSTVIYSGVAAAETLPAISLAIAVIVLTPSSRGVFIDIENSPFTSTCCTPINVP